MQPCTICNGLGTDEQGRTCPYADVHKAKRPSMHNIQSPRSDDAVETEIVTKGLTAPRITPDDITANIDDVEYVKHISKSGQVLRWAVATTRNGFAITGNPSCSVSPANDDAKIGEKIALANTTGKMRELMGYHLKEQLFQAKQPAQAPDCAQAELPL